MMASSTATQQVLAELDRCGYAVLPGVLHESEIDAVRRALSPHLERGPHGRNDFEGYATQRVYCLVAKSRAFDRMILDPFVLGVAGSVLGANFLLTATLAINLGPGETAQSLHYDDIFYRIPRPRPPVSLSTLWAIDTFSSENGATLVCPASHSWGDAPSTPFAPPTPSAPPTPPTPSTGRPEVVAVPMAAGSVLVYLGTLVHAGGANTTRVPRLGVSIQYAAAWARQQENFMMALGLDGARELPPRLQELIGYSIHPPFMGMVDGRHPAHLLERTDTSGQHA
jgi:ectoine hydroxylase-related dioxygenase (phytanoyl-CoA dioxygenase family)